MATRIVFADDHAGFRREVRLLLERAGYDVVGESDDAASTLRLADEVRPDVVLLDIGLPDMDGLSVARRLTAGDPSLVVVLISGREAGEYGPRLRSCGARGFVSKADLSALTLADVLAGPEE